MTKVEALNARLYSVKIRLLDMYHAAHAGHIGCSLSCTEMLVHLKFSWMQPEDRLILSKGHAAALLYSVFAEAGEISEETIGTFYHNGTTLPAHPPVNQVKPIPFATGSLGHGLSLSAGMAFGARMKGEARKHFCVTSDGELDEGSTWEAAMFIAHHRLTNVIWLIDRNSIQGIGRTEEVLRLEPLKAKLESFGFHVSEADGHDFNALERAKAECADVSASAGKPCVVICSTVKGHGVSYMEDTVDCHYLPMTEEQYHQAIDELKAWRAATSGRRHES
ncbi:MAG TPA: transketolase [Bacteroidota bacterium]|nr:transketolase [Bacteroidota bacterium]